MAQQPYRGKKDICSVLRTHLGQRTVLAVAIPVLENQIKAMKQGAVVEGLTEKQIEVGFRNITSKFIKSDYHSTYIQRRLGTRGFLELSGSRYRLRKELLGATLQELEQLREELIGSLRSAYEQRQAVIKKFQEACSLPGEHLQERVSLVSEYLSEVVGNRGEMFEVVSFAVLREYFRTFGFSLQRFSTTYANDGGMDFVGGEAIYQVTTDESIQKIRRDLAKAPGTKRVLVRPSVSPEVRRETEREVLEVIDLKDLLNHFIAWLLSRDARAKTAMHLQQVLEIALEQLQRENRADTASAVQQQ
jgi:hypothetical protein